MAQRVYEIMNNEIFAVREADSAEQTLSYILALGLSAAPVVDPYGRPVGFLSLRDILVRTSGAAVRDRMSAPAVSIRRSALIEEAADALASRDLHHAPVVSDEGEAIGIVSLLDIVKALRGHPVSHPPTFPHYDRSTGLVWTDDTALEQEHIDVAPDGPGLLALIRGGPGVPERVVWAESCHNLRRRVRSLVSMPEAEPPFIAALLERPYLRFRAAHVPGLRKRSSAVAALLEETARLLAPPHA